MKTIQSLILAVALTFIAISVLMTTIQYSSDIVSVRLQPENSFSSDINVTDMANNTGGPSSHDSGALQAKSSDKSMSIAESFAQTFSRQKISDMSGGEPPYYLLLLLLLLVLLLLLALVGFIVWQRRRRAKTAPPAPGNKGARPKGLMSHEGDYRIRFSQIREPFPVVWGANDALEVKIESKGDADEHALLYVDGKIAKELALEHGRALVWLQLEKGDHRIQVSAMSNDGSGEPSWADLQIVDYREEIVRIFNDMYQGYRSSYKEIDDEMTARELERVVRKSMPAPKQKALGTAITTFEVANYSPHAVQRRDYERMFVSRMDVT